MPNGINPFNPLKHGSESGRKTDADLPTEQEPLFRSLLELIFQKCPVLLIFTYIYSLNLQLKSLCFIGPARLYNLEIFGEIT